MHDVVTLIRQYGTIVVFAAVFIEGVGLPIPSFAVVLVAAAAIDETGASVLGVLWAALSAALLCDLAWYWAGHRLGYRLLRVLCKLSLSADSCVQKTESLFVRWGAPSLMVARFVPGFSVVAQPLAGAVGQRFHTFLFYDVIGVILWVAAAVLLGVVFSSAVDDVLDQLSRYGRIGTLILAGLFAAYLAYRLYRRRVFIRQLRMDRISVSELRSLIHTGPKPVVLDARPRGARLRDGSIPGSIAVDSSVLDELAKTLASVDEVIVYCACPNEASAVNIARQLLGKGARRVRPLLGGIDAWVEAGFDIETFAAVATTEPSASAAEH